MGFSPHKAELLLQSMELKNEKHIGKLIKRNPNISLNTRLKAIYFIDQTNQDLSITHIFMMVYETIFTSLPVNRTIVENTICRDPI